MTIKECKLEVIERYPEKKLGVSERLKGSMLVNQGFSEEIAIREARRCLGNIQCESCDLCRLFCPELAITRNEEMMIEIDHDSCTGCGICAFVCPKGAIKMVVK